MRIFGDGSSLFPEDQRLVASAAVFRAKTTTTKKHHAYSSSSMANNTTTTARAIDVPSLLLGCGVGAAAALCFVQVLKKRTAAQPNKNPGGTPADPELKLAATGRPLETLRTTAYCIHLDIAKRNALTMLRRAERLGCRLRPHVKTHKMAEVVRLQVAQGITRFKCATIAEAEMLAQAGARDVLLANQLVGPNARRLAKLFPERQRGMVQRAKRNHGKRGARRLLGLLL